MTEADRARARAALGDLARPDVVDAIAALLSMERQVTIGRFLGLADAWEHVAIVNGSAARGSYDDGLGKALDHAARAVRKQADVIDL